MKEEKEMWPWIIGIAAVVVVIAMVTTVAKKRKTRHN